MKYRMVNSFSDNQILMMMKKYEEAISAFEKSASVGPNAGKENKVSKLSPFFHKALIRPLQIITKKYNYLNILALSL